MPSIGSTTFLVSEPIVLPATMKPRWENVLCDHRTNPTIIECVFPERTEPCAITPS